MKNKTNMHMCVCVCVCVWKKSTALILALTMLLGLFAVSASAEADKDIYVYMGDSMSYDFPDYHDWQTNLHSIYPDQIAGKYNLEVVRKNAPGTLAHGGVRATDTYCMLSDYPGDKYTNNHFPGEITAEAKAAVRDKMENAALVTIMLGYSNFSVYFLDGLSDTLGTDENGYDGDLSQIFSEEELYKMMPVINRLKALITDLVPAETIAALDTILEENSPVLRNALTSLLGEDAAETALSVTDKIDRITDVFVYAVLSAMIHFDRTVATVRELNPDVPIYVLGLFNPIKNIKISFTLGEDEYVLPIGDIIGKVFEFLNLYFRVLSPVSTEYFFVENADHLETFGELAVKDSKAAEDFIYAMFGGKKSTLNAELRAKASSYVPVFQKALSDTVINITDIIATLPENAGDLISEFTGNDASVSDALRKYAKLDADGNIDGGEFMSTIIHVGATFVLQGIYVHPTQTAHDEMGRRMLAAMENPTIDPDAVRFHEKLGSFEAVMDILNASDTFDEVLSYLNEKLNVWDRDVIPVLGGVFSAVKAVFKSGNIFDILTKIIETIRNLFERIMPVVG